MLMPNLPDSREERLAKAQAALAEALQHSAENLSQGSAEHSAQAEITSDKAAYNKARELAFRHLGLDRSKSSGHLYRYLTEHDVAAALARQVVEDLTEASYIDDRRAAARIMRRYQGSKVRARRQMLQLFLRQGVAAGVAEAMLDELPEDAQSIQALLPPEWPTEAREDARLRRFLASRGYSWETIGRARQNLAQDER